MSPRSACVLPNTSLQLTRLACGKLDGAWPVEMRENEWAVA